MTGSRITRSDLTEILKKENLITDKTSNEEFKRIAGEFLKNSNNPIKIPITTTHPLIHNTLNTEQSQLGDIQIKDEVQNSNVHLIGDDIEIVDKNLALGKLESQIENNNTLANMTNLTNILEVLKLVPSYDGETSELNEFLVCAREASFNLEVEEKKKFTKLLKTKLTGTAFRVVNGRDFSSVEELKKILEEHFKVLSTPSEYLSKLNSSSQKFNEQIKDFAERLRQLAHKAKHAAIIKYEGKTSDVFNEEVNNITRNAFIMGLSDPIMRTACFAQGESIDFEGLVRITKNIETSQNLSKCWGEARLDNKFETSVTENGNEVKSKFFPKSCTFCNRTGHVVSECRQKQKKNSCYICGQQNHIARFCNNRPIYHSHNRTVEKYPNNNNPYINTNNYPRNNSNNISYNYPDNNSNNYSNNNYNNIPNNYPNNLPNFFSNNHATHPNSNGQMHYPIHQYSNQQPNGTNYQMIPTQFSNTNDRNPPRAMNKETSYSSNNHIGYMPRQSFSNNQSGN